METIAKNKLIRNKFFIKFGQVLQVYTNLTLSVCSPFSLIRKTSYIPPYDLDNYFAINHVKFVLKKQKLK